MGINLGVLQGISKAIVSFPYVLILFLVAMNFYRKNRKISKMQKLIIGKSINTPLELTLSEIVLGITGGIFSSVLLSYLGVGFSENSLVDLIFLFSLLSLSFKTKAMNFAYTASIMGFISILIEIMKGLYSADWNILSVLSIDVVSLMTMVAIIYLTQGILIMIDGGRGSIPVFSKRNGEIIGGFALKRSWIIPCAIIILTTSNNYSISETYSLSHWKTFLTATNPMVILSGIVLFVLPLFGVLNFSTFTFSKSKKEKSFIYGAFMIGYSCILFVLARLGTLNVFFKLATVIFAPAALEAIEIFQNYKEINSKPKYTSNDDGVMVLEVVPDSPAYNMGIKSGDRLVTINDKKIKKEEDILEIIKETSSNILLKIKKATGILEEVRYSKTNGINALGVILVPISLPQKEGYILFEHVNKERIIDKIKNKDN
ncbi:PDZ domain-containing protein [Clostridium grantii]|uniref:PDZ domain-containing protein n=1 Tax=Clostridium grantii DSM 8605 TaxID=1121316 RepID=A0A1M5U537_9CLOT|nr:PDZ domain-containing protein [Clostridium grantii]SHH58084.1 PDZ domain-containing protein [Clostridium grantii DSM 8605]